MEENASEWVNKAIEIGVPFLINLVAALVIYIIGKWLAGVLSRLTAKVLEKGNVDKALANFAKNIVYAAILVFTIIAAIGKLGVATTSFVAIIGAAGLAIGMALSGTLQNFASGVMILLFKPFKVGDFIDAGGTAGTVKDIQIFNTIISTPDNKKIIAPNSIVSSGIITNVSDTDMRRVDLVFGVGYSDDLKKAKEVLMGIIEADSRILKDPAPLVAVSELADSSVNLVCRPWVKPADYWGVYFDLTEKAKVELEAAGLSIPFPQQDVWMHQVGKEFQSA